MADSFAAMLRLISVQKSQTRSTGPGAGGNGSHAQAWKFACRSLCQPGFRVLTHSGSVGPLFRSSTLEGVRWTTYTCFAQRPRWGTIWMPVKSPAKSAFGSCTFTFWPLPSEPPEPEVEVVVVVQALPASEYMAMFASWSLFCALPLLSITRIDRSWLLLSAKVRNSRLRESGL